MDAWNYQRVCAILSTFRLNQVYSMFRKILTTLVLSSTLIACAHTSGGIATSNIPLEPASYRILGQAKGGDCQYKLLGIIPLTGGNETHSALEDALTDIPNTTALVQITSDTYSQYWILWSNTCTQVHGTAVAAN
ncbi:hypothetical protein BPLS_P1084 [Bathymodiolus platifrons methanotrophic gill symbiont]|uniref:hypothetical protein n=1 Tax=Bathymodiolus platifrons methanotrophic gill symbiont TaxID=113268 RepID=UPI001B48D4DF|nr:hypothetical protein [Bathymodiolus platifrons methanotrophic gill symbiont]GFO74394.1 hypothetical protein BPLS_P1084 [Bathymodiolus platifrons methanotrophic gill symbiont]